jgi:hypothetical protein
VCVFVLVVYLNSLKLTQNIASHKSNPSSVLRGIVDSYSTLPWVTWHWCTDSIVVNDPLGETGLIPLYVGLPSAWGSMDGDLMFFLYVCRKAHFGGLRHTYMNK